MSRKRRPRTHKAITPEVLESKTLLTTASLSFGELVIEGTDQDEHVAVLVDGAEIAVSIQGRDGGRFNAVDVDAIRFNGYDGNDYFRNFTSLTVVAIGGEGHDTLVGGSSIDILRGNGGNDDLRGAGGRDFIYGNGGNDILRGSTGNDKLSGDLGDDTVLGGSGSDTIYGGLDFHQTESEVDSLVGGSGKDTMFGSGGSDIMRGGSGSDLMFGGEGADRMQGGSHNDTLAGNAGNDILLGNMGNDELFGNANNDTLNGGDGVDRLKGGDGQDVLNGGRFDNDEDYLHGGDDADVFHQWGKKGSWSEPTAESQLHGEDIVADLFSDDGINDTVTFHRRRRFYDPVINLPTGPVVETGGSVGVSAAVAVTRAASTRQGPARDLEPTFQQNDAFFAQMLK
jgi:Ca2+-binding RTX toxin-like protein